MTTSRDPPATLRRYRNSKLYRPLARVLRIYNLRIVDALHARGFDDFSLAFPRILSNLDTEGTRIGVLAERAGMTRQGAGQLLVEIERCGYVQRQPSKDDARVTIVRFTPYGRKLLGAVFEIVEATEREFAQRIGADDFERVRIGLAQLADAIDPTGRLGAADE